MTGLPFLDGTSVAAALPLDRLIEELDLAFRDLGPVPPRAHIGLDRQAGVTDLLLMPAWKENRLAVKLVTLGGGDGSIAAPTINGVVVLFNLKTGRPMAMLDAGELTARRTAAASALASRYLSCIESSRLVLIGTGRLAPFLVEAHCLVRPVEEIVIIGRDEVKAGEVVKRLPARLAAHASTRSWDRLDEEVAAADIVSTATSATVPFIKRAMVRPGSHVDLVGSYRPSMREVDSQTVQQASVFVDTRGGALSEAGDLIAPIEEGLFDESRILADLAELCSGRHPGRQFADEITLFKSVGTAIEDLVAASLALEHCTV